MVERNSIRRGSCYKIGEDICQVDEVLEEVGKISLVWLKGSGKSGVMDICHFTKLAEPYDARHLIYTQEYLDPDAETKKRVEEELSDLKARQEKLAIFLLSDKYKKIKPIQQYYLAAQNRVMQDYIKILQDRLINW